MDNLMAQYTASISELKNNPTALLKKSKGEAIAVLNHNKPTAYLVPAELYESLMEQLENAALMDIVNERLNNNEKCIDVRIEDL